MLFLWLNCFSLWIDAIPVSGSSIPGDIQIHVNDLSSSSSPVPLTSTTENNQDCIVCMEPLTKLENGPTVPMPACPHRFHAPCIEEWLKNNPNCPICRAKAREIIRWKELEFPTEEVNEVNMQLMVQQKALHSMMTKPNRAGFQDRVQATIDFVEALKLAMQLVHNLIADDPRRSYSLVAYMHRNDKFVSKTLNPPLIQSYLQSSVILNALWNAMATINKAMVGFVNELKKSAETVKQHEHHAISRRWHKYLGNRLIMKILKVLPQITAQYQFLFQVTQLAVGSFEDELIEFAFKEGTMSRLIEAQQRVLPINTVSARSSRY